MEDYRKIFEEYLSQCGLKLTIQRKRVIDCIFEIHDHFNVDMLYDRIRLIDKDVSRATIYRTIPLLTASGLIRKSESRDGKDRDKEFYEHIYGHPKHFHLLCLRCGKIIEVDEDKEIRNILSKISKRHNFEINDYRLAIEGVCIDCQLR